MSAYLQTHLTPPSRPWTSCSQIQTHQMERQRQHQEKYPQIEVAGVVEFVLVRVVVPASGQRCPDSLTQGLHNLWAHLASSLLLSDQVERTDAAAAAATLQLNDLLWCIGYCCLCASMLGQYITSPELTLSCLIDLPPCCPLLYLFPFQCRFVHCGTHDVLFSSLLLPLLSSCTDAQLWPPPLPSQSSSLPPSHTILFYYVIPFFSVYLRTNAAKRLAWKISHTNTTMDAVHST